jgi:hypothetical protein
MLMLGFEGLSYIEVAGVPWNVQTHRTVFCVSSGIKHAIVHSETCPDLRINKNMHNRKHMRAGNPLTVTLNYRIYVCMFIEER